jgi:CRISPR-associated protein Csx10
MIQLTFAIDLQSDYHISAGHGVGLLDSALQRDADGVPVIRGTTLVGLLRQGLRDLAEAPAFKENKESKPFWRRFEQIKKYPSDPGRSPEEGDVLFGGPWSPKRWFISSARPAGLLEPQDAPKSASRFGGHAAAHVRVSPALRRAEARKLFIREEGDKGLRFIFTAECPFIDEEACREATLMVAVARMVRFMGAGRRRGRGACTIKLVEVSGWPSPDKATQTSLLQAFAHYWLKGQPFELLPKLSTPEAEEEEELEPSESLRLIMLLRTDEPLLVARRAAAGNQFEALDYIPGLSIRGAVGASVGARCDLDNNQANRTAFTQLFFRSKVRFSPLYPCHQEEEFVYAAIPAPEDLFVSERHPGKKKLKQTGHNIYTARGAAQIDFSEKRADGQEAKLAPLSNYLAVLEEVPLVSVSLRSEMHVTIDPHTGRALDENLFSYAVIPTGKYFMGEWVFSKAEDWITLRQMAGLPAAPEEGVEGDMAGEASEVFSLRLGKAIRRGYGKVSAVLMRPHKAAAGLFAGLPLEERVKKVNLPLTMTLISSTIVLDAWGRCQQGFDEPWLSKELGVQVEMATQKGPLDIAYALKFAKSQVIDSFNNKMGLARHRDMALAAGSAVTLVVKEALDLSELQARLADIELRGLGVRRNEGFGRVIFNHPVYQDGCQGVEATEIEIPDELRLGKALADTIYSKTAAFESAWRKQLTTYTPPQWKTIRHAQFSGMAREIDSAWVRSLTDANNLFDSYGKVEHLLVGALLARPKLQFFTNEERGKPGVDFLKGLFRELATRIEQEATNKREQTLLWIMGCRELARRMNEVIPEKEEER